MAAKQASALGRHGRLRDGVITTLKSVLPRQFSELEHRIASRLSDVDDEALIAYLSYLLEAAVVDGRISGASLVGTDELRAALRDTGVVVPDGDDLADWANAVRTARRRVEGPAVGGPVLALPAPEGRDDGGALEPRPGGGRRRSLADAARERTQDRSGEEPDEPAGAGGSWAAWDGTQAPPSALPAESEHTGWAPQRTRTLSSIAAAKAAGAFDKPDVPDPSPYPSPLQRAGDWMDHDGGAAATRTDRTDRAGSDDGPPAPADGEAGLNSGDGPRSDSKPSKNRNRRSRRGGAKSGARRGPDGSGATDRAATPDPAPAPDAERRAPAGSSGAEEGSGGGRRAETAPAADGSRSGVGWADAAKPAPKVVRGPALRPELFPTLPGAPATKRAGRRTTRTKATPPDSRTFDMPPSKVGDDAELTDELRGQLSAAVAIPRPVFTSDLASMFGSEAVVEKWQNECRASSDSEVRFVAPKSRHRLRGSLVVPIAHLRSAAVEFKRSWWAECIEHHKKAGKLYELAVLLHSAGEQVVSYKVHEHKETVLLRLKQPRGVVGVAVVMEGRLGEGETTRNALVEDVEELMAGTLELLVVLAINDPAYAPMVEALEQEGAARGWQPPCHVVAARSWEYAAGNTAALRHVLG